MNWGSNRKIENLKSKLERLQAENAAEWGKRERLETEKLALERDNKKVRAEIRDLQERAERRGRPITNTESEYRNLQQELADKNKVSTVNLCGIDLPPVCLVSIESLIPRQLGTFGLLSNSKTYFIWDDV